MSSATTQRQSSRTSKASTPKARFSMLSLTIAALVVGVVIVGVLLVTSGVLDRSPSRELVLPEVSRPTALVDGRAVGAPDAPITIEVWEDFQCPACGVFSRSTEPRLLEEYVATGKVRLVYRDMAFLGRESIDAAVAARAAQQLLGADGFWRFHDLLFHNQDGENEGAFDRSVLADMAVSLGIDRDAFLALLDDPALIAAVEAETQAGARAGRRARPPRWSSTAWRTPAPRPTTPSRSTSTGSSPGPRRGQAGDPRPDRSGRMAALSFLALAGRRVPHVGQAERHGARVRGPVGLRDGREQPLLPVPGHPRRSLSGWPARPRCWPGRCCGGAGAPIAGG